MFTFYDQPEPGLRVLASMHNKSHFEQIIWMSFLVAGISTGVVWADNIHYLNSGPAVTVGPISNAQMASSSRFNPAVTALNTDTTRLTLLDFTTNVQLQGLGEFNTVFQNMTDQIDSISATFDDFGNGDASVGDVLAGEIGRASV